MRGMSKAHIQASGHRQARLQMQGLRVHLSQRYAKTNRSNIKQTPTPLDDCEVIIHSSSNTQVFVAAESFQNVQHH